MFRSAIVLIMLLSLTVGCERLVPGANRVAIVDLDVIAQAFGSQGQIKDQIDTAQKQIAESLNTQLQNVRDELQRQLDEEKSRIGKRSTKEDQARLARLGVQANRQMQVYRQLAQQRNIQVNAQVRAALVKHFRDGVLPFVEKVAQSKGMTVVMTATDALIWFDPAVDITDEVIAEARAAGGLPKLPGVNLQTPAEGDDNSGGSPMPSDDLQKR